MECIKHFSHKHPLSFFQLDDDENPKPYKCHICGLPILSSPSYTCSIDANCNIFLHKACTQLPRDFYHHGHLEFLNLELRARHHYETYDSSPHNYTYKCTDYSDCGFELHPLVAKTVEIKSKHRSHKKQPLVACCRESLVSLCDACGKKEEGFFFNCQECNFWIHQDCAILPAIIKLSISPHPYILTYDPPFHTLNKHTKCQICNRPWRLRYKPIMGYFCGTTYEMVHVACAKSKMENLQTETIQEFIQLPDEEDTFPSLVIRRSAENSSNFKKIFHKHPLILEDGSNVSSSSREAVACGDSVCDVCIQPLDFASPFYRCQSEGCHFLAHNICANKLQRRVEFYILGNRLTGVPSASTTFFFNSVFFCMVCLRPSNGFAYKVLNGRIISGFCDVECAYAPRSINHASHGQHPMFQIPPLWKTSNPLSCCSAESFIFDTYRCVVCDFSIHIRCALLPKRTRHKFDEHPLELIMTHHHNEDKQREVFCEVCEQDIELKLWYYGCHKCEHYFHINCIPSVGYFSKVKFGKTLSDDRVHPKHPLTLTRMLTHERHERCGICNQIIKGFSDDEMAFHCSPCHFWVHFSCAAATSGLNNYSVILEIFKQRSRQQNIKII